MKRLHVSFSVKDLEHSVRFYSALFGTPPTVLKQDYAKWMLEDPRVNFVIESRGEAIGFSHVGIQVESEDELQDLYKRFRAASGGEVLEQEQTTCCYAVSDKNWVLDPQSVAWEAFYTRHPSDEYGQPGVSGALKEGELLDKPSATGCACGC
ncbi:MAG: ArsI/CadI family heavy metal resistance metalloenzyme [Parvularculales bacterium]